MGAPPPDSSESCRAVASGIWPRSPRPSAPTTRPPSAMPRLPAGFSSLRQPGSSSHPRMRHPRSMPSRNSLRPPPANCPPASSPNSRLGHPFAIPMSATSRCTWSGATKSAPRSPTPHSRVLTCRAWHCLATMRPGRSCGSSAPKTFRATSPSPPGSSRLSGRGRRPPACSRGRATPPARTAGSTY